MFNNNPNRQQTGIFGPTQTTTQTGNPIFGGNQIQPPQQGGIFNNQTQPQTPNLFNNQTQQGASMFNNQPQQPNTIFGGNQPTNQQKPSIFGGTQQTNTTNLFSNQPQQQNTVFGGGQQQATGIFAGQQPQNTIFGGQQPQNTIFGGQQPQNTIFGGQQQQGPSIFGGQQQQNQSPNIFGSQKQQMNTNQLFQLNMSGKSQSQRLKDQIQEFSRKVDLKNLEYIKLDEMNMFNNLRLSQLPEDIKKAIFVLINNMKQLRDHIEQIRRQNDDLDKKAQMYCKGVQQKLTKYKECLIQNIQQSNLLEEVKQQVEMIQSQVNSVIIPLYNSYKTGKHFSFDSPDEFSSTICKKILQKMIALNNKLDEIISCQQKDENSISQQDASTIMVLQELLNYYENVSAKVLEFTNRYNAVKQLKIEQNKRHLNSEDVIRRIKEKVNDKMAKDFRCYDLIKEIEDILQKRQKKEQELPINYKKSNPRYFGSQNPYSWQRY